MSFRPALATGIGILVLATTPAFGQEPARTGRLAAPPASAAATDYFLKIKGVEGESKDKDHKNWIDLLSVSSDITRTGAARSATSSDLTFTKTYDRSSPKLLEACAKGTHSEGVVLVGPSSAGTPMRWKLEKVRITSYNLDASGERPIETITMTFEKVDAQTASAGNVETTWKVEEGES